MLLYKGKYLNLKEKIFRVPHIFDCVFHQLCKPQESIFNPTRKRMHWVSNGGKAELPVRGLMKGSSARRTFVSRG